jgi:hypothetical protein
MHNVLVCALTTTFIIFLCAAFLGLEDPAEIYAFVQLWSLNAEFEHLLSKERTSL